MRSDVIGKGSIDFTYDAKDTSLRFVSVTLGSN
jgi:hypothetical protein